MITSIIMTMMMTATMMMIMVMKRTIITITTDIQGCNSDFTINFPSKLTQYTHLHKNRTAQETRKAAQTLAQPSHTIQGQISH